MKNFFILSDVFSTICLGVVIFLLVKHGLPILRQELIDIMKKFLDNKK